MPETNVLNRLLTAQDVTYREFQIKLLPTVAPDSVIGVRTPELRKIAKEMIKSGEAAAFIAALPHRYFDENQLHAFILSEEKDFATCVEQVEAFLPYVDNWATCDQLSPKAFKKRPDALLPYIDQWIKSDHPYTVRFGVGMLMQHFLDERFDPAYQEKAAQIQSGEYYVNMMIAWYFATALAKQYEAAFPYIQNGRLSPWTHNKAIQKALESYRVPDEHKEALRKCKLSGKAAEEKL